MSYWFIIPSQRYGQQVTLQGSDAHHLARVQRARQGDEIIVSDGQGTAYRVRLQNVSPQEVGGEIVATIPQSRTEAVEITLYQGICKGERMAWLIQKTTELGVAQLVPLLTERTVVRLNSSQASSKRRRWQTIAREAAQQSRRPTIPEIAAPVPLSQARENLALQDLVLLLHPAATSRSFRATLRSHEVSRQENTSPPPRVALCIGPEGGFTDPEIDALASVGAIPVHLGPSILRTETAGIVAVALVRYEYGGYEG